MSASLPLRANLEWLKKLSKQRLAELRADTPDAKLSDAQRAVAREFGFPSWPQLKSYVDQLRHELGKLAKPHPNEPPTPPDDPELQQLLSAIQTGDLPLVARLLERRPILVRSYARDGRTPLHEAARYNDPAMCAWLLAYGADPEAKFGQSGHTALSWAATCNAPESAKALLKLGGKPDLFSLAGVGLNDAVRACFDGSGNLLPGASRTGSSRFAVDGTRLPCPPLLPQEQISDALSIAARNAHVEVVRFLLTKQPDLSFRGFMGGTALHWAYFGGSHAVIELLEQAGAEPNARDDILCCTPRAFGISVAASWGIDSIVKRLLSGDPRLANSVDSHTSPLHEAARAGHAQVVQLLLDHQADSNFRDGSGRTPLELAVQSGHAAVVDVLKQV
jgi:ankyrin repeat protein